MDELDELMEMQSLSDANRERVGMLTDAFRELENFRGPKMLKYSELADKLSGKLPAISRKTNTISVSSLMRLYSAWKAEGWRALAVEYARKSNYVHLPDQFVQLWKEYYVRYNVDRSGVQARRALLARLESWRNGDISAAIPGYSAPPTDQPAKDYPAGWSLKNLMKKKPTRIHATLIKEGRSAAKAQFGPLIRHTRMDLEPGSLIVFDDVWQDHKVTFPGAKNLVRPLALVALDCASGKQIEWGMRPRLIKEDGKSTGLNAFDMEKLLTAVLCNVGTHKDGCVLAMERGTANVSEKTERFLFDKFKVRVERGGVDRAASYFGGFVGNFKGNSRFKAALESHHNLCHNWLSFLPAYTGKDRTEPENTQGMTLAYAAIVRKLEKQGVPRAIIDRISVGSCDWITFLQTYQVCLDLINARTDHTLEGWQRRQVTEVRLSAQAPWMITDTLKLSPMVLDALTCDAELHRTRQMSPTEAFALGANNLRRLRFDLFGEIFVQENSTARMIKRVTDRHEFVIKPTLSDPTEYIFSSEIQLPNGGTRVLETGEEYAVLLNDFVGDQLCVYTLDGRLIGSTFARKTRVPYNDRDAILPELGKAAKEFNKSAHPANYLAASKQKETVTAALNNELALAEFRQSQQAITTTKETAKERALDADKLAITQTLEVISDNDDEEQYPETHF